MKFFLTFFLPVLLAACGTTGQVTSTTPVKPKLSDTAFVREATSGIEIVCPEGQVFVQSDFDVESTGSTNEWDHSRTYITDGRDRKSAYRGRYPTYGDHVRSPAVRHERDVGSSRTAGKSATRTGKCVEVKKGGVKWRRFSLSPRSVSLVALVYTPLPIPTTPSWPNALASCSSNWPNGSSATKTRRWRLLAQPPPPRAPKALATIQCNRLSVSAEKPGTNRYRVILFALSVYFF